MTQPADNTTRQAELIGAPIVPAAIAVVYGVYRSFREEFQIMAFPHSYFLIAGGILSIAIIYAYAVLKMSSPIPSFKNAIIAFSGLVPYIFALYLLLFLGVFSLVDLVMTAFSLVNLLFGLFWILLGYRMLYAFWKLTEIGN